tara:strand:- start:329 stop:1378 length:1050 start_codon:yes stop_codon:yes gene_type:complete
MKIYDVPGQRRYWVVRAEAGRYFDHFIHYGLVALGHLNRLNIQDCVNADAILGWEDLKERYEASQGALDNSKQQTSSHLAQVRSFLYEMSVGDWVVTVGRGGVRFGRIVGRPAIKKEKLVVLLGPDGSRSESMEMHLQRAVVWGPGLSRGNLPYGLQLSLKANQTVFSLDAKWDAIYHSLYPAFTRDGKLFLSAKIRKKEDIRNHDISTIFRLLDEVEIIGKEMALRGHLGDFENSYAEYIDQNKLTNTTKAQFHSPGDIWNAISGTVGNLAPSEWIPYTVLAYAMLFGNQKLGFDGLVDLQTRQKIWDLILQRLKANRADNVVDSVQLELPKIDTSALEDHSKDQPGD